PYWFEGPDVFWPTSWGCGLLCGFSFGSLPAFVHWIRANGDPQPEPSAGGSDSPSSSGTSRPPLHGESLGIPTGLPLGQQSFWDVFLPADSCEFGPCDFGFQKRSPAKGIGFPWVTIIRQKGYFTVRF